MRRRKNALAYLTMAAQFTWSISKSIGWAIWHGFLNWIYVVYRWIVGG